MYVRFWSTDGGTGPTELILGPFDYISVMTNPSGGLTQVRMVDQNGSDIAWMSTLSPIVWYVPNRRGHFQHVMWWQPAPVVAL